MNGVLIVCVSLGGLMLVLPLLKSLFTTSDKADIESMIRLYLNDTSVEEGHRRALKGQLAMVLAHHSRHMVEGLITHETDTE